MKIAYLTAGAAGMFCGSCMHDNTLASALTRAGADCQLIPTYTPIRTDESDVSVDQVFFGGINVYLQQKVPLFRHLPKFLDHFLDNPRLIRRVTNRATHIDPAELGGLTVSMLKGSGGYQRKEVLRLCEWLKTHHRPEVVVFTNILIGGCLPTIRRDLGIPTVVTLQGDDIFLESLPETFRRQALTEIRRLADDVDLYLAHSEYYADFMAEFLGLDRNKIVVTPLAIDTREFEVEPEARDRGAAPTVGYLARLAPEKGFDELVDAFIQLRQHSDIAYQLRIAGWLGDHQREFAEAQFQKLRQAGLADAFEYLGTVDRVAKLKFLHEIDLLCVPTRYRDPKGLFALEAMASGVPVLLPDHGAFPEMLADTQGGRLFRHGDRDDLVGSLQTLLDASQERASLGRAGRQAVLGRRNADVMAATTLEILRGRLGLE